MDESMIIINEIQRIILNLDILIFTDKDKNKYIQLHEIFK